MVVVINEDMVTNVEEYLPLAKAFAEDAVKNDKGCISNGKFHPELQGFTLKVYLT